MEMNSVWRFRTLLEFHCTDPVPGRTYRIAAIVLHCVSTESGAAKHGAATVHLYPVSEALGRHSFLKINFLNLAKL